jgi:protoporphyrinogen oxidase
VSDVEIVRGGTRARQRASAIISTMPLNALIGSLGTAPPAGVQRAAHALSYRDFLTVALVVKRRDVFPDTWIYIHDPRVKVGRIQNFKNWSPDMVPDPAQTCLGLEYFCTAGDDVWSMADKELVTFATAELQAIGLVHSADVIDGTVVRAPKAYPIYDDGYAGAVKDIRAYLERFTNLQTIGRNGTHTYNNQDHSMVMGMLAARNLLGERHDVWTLNSENEYLEEMRDPDKRSPRANGVPDLSSTQPLRPSAIPGRATRLTATR